MSRERTDRFEELVAAALDDLPEWIRERMDNVEVFIEAHAPRGEPGLLGLYQGVPLANRSWYSAALPDRITLFRDPIERQAGDDPARLQRLIAHVVVHEIAHHFGITDDRLRDIDAY